MITLNRHNRYASKTNIQRFVYAIALAFWTFSWFSNIDFLREESKYGFDFLWIALSGVILFTYQTLLNSKIIWVTLFGIIGFFYFKFIYEVAFFFLSIEFNNYVGSREFWELILSVLLGVVLIFVMLALNPEKKKTVPNKS